MVLEFLSYQFGVRAMIGGLIIAVTCSSLGVFLVLRKRCPLSQTGSAMLPLEGLLLGYSREFIPYTRQSQGSCLDRSAYMLSAN